MGGGGGGGGGSLWGNPGAFRAEEHPGGSMSSTESSKDGWEELIVRGWKVNQYQYIFL